MTKKPNSLRHLDDAIRRICGNSPDEYVRARTLMANAIVAQMLPDGVVKGGSAVKMRFGNAATRFTTDLDTTTASDPTKYAKELDSVLARGWEGFTGRVVPRNLAQPKDVPPDYVMQPFDVKLSYNGKPWCTVPLEVGHNEIGDADKIDWVRLADAERIFTKLGFPAPGMVPIMPLSHQIAQKLHALTSVGDRARDLIDLQLIAKNAELDLDITRRTCERLFAYRKKQAWPPIIEKWRGWDELYAETAKGLPVEQNLDRAIAWANNLVSEIAGSRPPHDHSGRPSR